jgi:hypothetical protein
MHSTIEISVFDQVTQPAESAQPSIFEQIAELTRPAQYSTPNEAMVTCDDQESIEEVFDCLESLRLFKTGMRESFSLKELQAAISALQRIERVAEEV